MATFLLRKRVYGIHALWIPSTVGIVLLTIGYISAWWYPLIADVLFIVGIWVCVYGVVQGVYIIHMWIEYEDIDVCIQHPVVVGIRYLYTHTAHMGTQLGRALRHAYNRIAPHSSHVWGYCRRSLTQVSTHFANHIHSIPHTLGGAK